jgi:hypothetical protein
MNTFEDQYNFIANQVAQLRDVFPFDQSKDYDSGYPTTNNDGFCLSLIVRSPEDCLEEMINYLKENRQTQLNPQGIYPIITQQQKQCYLFFMERENEFEWRQFCRLGEAIGDGLHYEDPWISKEYRRLSRLLIPEIKEQEAERRKAKAEALSKKMDDFLVGKKCECGGALKQKRKGTLVCYCELCGARYKAKYRKQLK